MTCSCHPEYHLLGVHQPGYEPTDTAKEATVPEQHPASNSDARKRIEEAKAASPAARDFSPELLGMVRKAISDAYYDARNDGQTMEVAADRAVDALKPILASVDENAHRRGSIEARRGA